MLQAVAFAIRTVTSTTTKYSPGELIFGRDMILHIKETADWSLLRERKAVQQTTENERENARRSNHVYSVGDKVLLVTRRDERKGKLKDFEHKGPFEVLKVYGNGTLKVQFPNFSDIIHIRRLKA